jgi:hypothetical protein
MWLPSGIVDCDNFSDKDITFDNLANLCFTQRAWANVIDMRWPVSNHSYLSGIICAHLLKNKEWDEKDRYRAIVLSFLHDSEEVFVTDIPTPFKSEDTRQIGDNIRNAIFDFLDIQNDDKMQCIVDLSDIISLFWEVKFGYKHWKDVGLTAIKPVFIKRCHKLLKYGISIQTIQSTIVWVGLTDIVTNQEIAEMGDENAKQ